MDITSRVSCAGESPLKLPEYHYGGMAIRGRPALDARSKCNS